MRVAHVLKFLSACSRAFTKPMLNIIKGRAERERFAA